MKPRDFKRLPFPPAEKKQVVSFAEVARSRKQLVDTAVEYGSQSHQGSHLAEATIAHHMHTITSRAVELEHLRSATAPVIPINRTVELETSVAVVPPATQLELTELEAARQAIDDALAA